MKCQFELTSWPLSSHNIMSARFCWLQAPSPIKQVLGLLCRNKDQNRRSHLQSPHSHLLVCWNKMWIILQFYNCNLYAIKFCIFFVNLFCGDIYLWWHLSWFISHTGSVHATVYWGRKRWPSPLYRCKYLLSSSLWLSSSQINPVKEI